MEIYNFGPFLGSALRQSKDGEFRRIVVEQLKPLLIRKIERGLGQHITSKDAHTLHNGLHPKMTAVLHAYARTLRWLIECEEQDFEVGVCEQLISQIIFCAAPELASSTAKKGGTTPRASSARIDQLVKKHSQVMREDKISRKAWAKKISAKLKGNNARTPGTVNRILARLGFPAR